MSRIPKLTRISSKRLQVLLEHKAMGNISDEENTELGIYADNFANILIRTPSVRRYLQYNDPTGVKDIENEMRAQVQIAVIGRCPFTYEPDCGTAYSYCLYCSHSAVCEVMRRHNYSLKNMQKVEEVVNLFGCDFFPAKKICTSQKTNL